MRGKKCIIILFQAILLLSTFPTIQSDFATAYETTTAENTNEAFVLNSTYPTIKILDSNSGAPRPVSSIEALKYTTEKKLIFYINDEPQYDEAGYPVQEKTAKILISKDQLIDYFGDISDIALNYAFKVYNETTWEIDVTDITNTEIIIKKFTEPELGTKWFTKGSTQSVRLDRRPMFIEISEKNDRGLVLKFQHPVCNDGQDVYINETWLHDQGINDPYFEWGDTQPWKPLDYEHENDTYILHPEHFSVIGIHDKDSGTTDAWVYDYDEISKNIYADPAYHHFQQTKNAFLEQRKNYETSLNMKILRSRFCPIANPSFEDYRSNYDGNTRYIRGWNADSGVDIVEHNDIVTGKYVLYLPQGDFKKAWQSIDFTDIDAISFKLSAFDWDDSTCFAQNTNIIFYDTRYLTGTHTLKFMVKNYGIHSHMDLWVDIDDTTIAKWRSTNGPWTLKVYIDGIRTYNYDYNNVFFSDDFESGDLSAWTTTSLQYDSGVKSDLESGGSPYEGSYCLELEGESYVEKQLSLSSLTPEYTAFIIFNYKLSSFESSEQLQIELWDGSQWIRVHQNIHHNYYGSDSSGVWYDSQFADNVWRSGCIWIPPELYIPNFKFRFVLEDGSESDYACIDNVKVLTAINPYNKQVIFYDNFNSGDFSKWDVSNSVQIETGGRYGQYRACYPYDSTSYTIKNLDLSGYSDVWLTFRAYRCLSIQMWNPDAGIWETIASSTGGADGERWFDTRFIDVKVPEKFLIANTKLRVVGGSSWNGHNYLYYIELYALSPKEEYDTVCYYNFTVSNKVNLTRISTYAELIHRSPNSKNMDIFIKTDKMDNYIRAEIPEHIIFHDSFESGDLSAWDSTSGFVATQPSLSEYKLPALAYRGAYVAQLDGGSGYLIKTITDADQYSNLVVSFVARIWRSNSHSYLYIKVYNGDWHTIKTIDTGSSSGSWYGYYKRYVAYIDNKFLSDTIQIKIEAYNNLYMYLDDVYIGCSPSLSEAANQSTFISIKAVGHPFPYEYWFLHHISFNFEYGRYWENNLQRTTGVYSESNHLSVQTCYDLVGNPILIIAIPVSTEVKGILEVENSTTTFSETTSISSIDIGNYYFDAADHTVYIGINDTQRGQTINIYVNCTYGGEFALTLPSYLRSGDYFMARGLIKDPNGVPLNGVIARTVILSDNGSEILSVEWNCTGGNYQATISTTGLPPGVYHVQVEFYDTSSGVTFRTGNILYLGTSISGGSGGDNDIFASAYLYYTVFDQNTGAKLEDDFYKFYISSDPSIDEYDRVMGGKYPVVLGQTYYIQIRDYWNNKIYPTDADYDEVFIDRAEFYYDVGIPFNQFLIKNSNDSVVYFRMTNGPLDGATNTWYARWIPPYESAEIFVRTGMYNISIQYYDPSDPTHLLKTVNITNLYIDTDYFYWIPGYKIGDIIIAVWNTNSSILNQIINVGVYVKNMNSSIINQIVNSTYLVENINTSIRYQTSVIQMMLNNTESNITNQINVMQQEIDNHLTNITNQVNHMWQSVNNTNTSIINQLNAVWQEVNNTNTTLVNQVNMIMQHIINHLNLQSTRTMLPGTIRYWTFDNESFKDSKGNDPIATNNVSFSNEGKYGGAAQFSGEESYICAANGFNLSNGTVEIWIKADFGNEKDRGIVNKSEVFSIEYNATDQKLIGAVAKDGQAFIKEEYNSKDDIIGVLDTQNRIYIAQTFKVGNVGSPGPYTIGKVRLMAARVNLPGTVYCNITHVNAQGIPTGDPISTSCLDANSWAEYVDDNSYQWVTFNMTPAVLEPDTEYAIVISQPNQTEGYVKFPYTYKGYPGGQIVMKKTSGNIVILSSDNLRFEVYSVGRLHVETAFNPDGQWHHIVLTWQRLWNDTNSNWDTLLRMYVDGTLVDQSETSSELTFNSTEPLYIGCTDINHSWKGLLDELFIYNRALTSDEAYYRYAGFSPMTQWNVILQDIDNANASIRTQINHLSQIVNNTNASIHIQLNAIEQLINNTNSTIHSQLNIIVQKVDNANASIHAQLNIINQEIQNLNSTIEYQYNALSQKIVNFEANITGQINSVWLEVNNTNTSIHQQLNLISADIYNMNTSIHTQLNAIMGRIDNLETNITDQTNLINVKIDNMNSSLTNQINSVNMTIINHNTSVMNQLNAILTQIINSNASIMDQVNLIWNEINNTNASIHIQLNAIQNDIANANATIHTQINAISTQITNTETNITEQLNTINIKISNTESNITNQINGVNITIINHNTSVMDQLNAIAAKIENTNTSIIDQINLIWNTINNTNASIQTQITGVHTTITTFWSDVNYSFSVIQSDISYHNTTIVNLIDDMNASLYAKLVSVLDNVSEAGESVFDKTMEILEKMGNLTGNVTLNDRLIAILDNISDTRVEILNKTIDILDILGEKVNNATFGEALWDVLENITSMQQQMAENFSYVTQVAVDLTNETLEMLDEIYNALLDVNATAMKDLYALLEEVLRQFRLPHEWRLPQVNYTLEDNTPPVTTISAEITINSEIRVTWSSVDNVPLNVAYVDLYYKVENASYWKEWKLHQPATGTLIFREEEPIEGKTYWFMALGTDSSGNKENQTDSNTCSIVYEQFVLSVSGLPTNPVQAALQNVQLILLAVALIILALVALLIYLRREQQNA